LYLAQERYFNSFFFLAAGFLPFPGAQLVLWVLFINLMAMMILSLKKLTRPENAGLLIIHVGLVLYFVAAFMVFHLSREASVRLAEGTKTNMAVVNRPNAAAMTLPFTIQLDQFKAEFHPGTQVPKSFESMVTLSTASMQRQVRIYMNHPLRYKDYTVYQASYDMEGGVPHSTLAVVKNSMRLMPYIACFVVFFGLALHFFMQAFAVKGRR
jgi:cytochrome c biogenesis factor